MQEKLKIGFASERTWVRTSVNYDVVENLICTVRFVRKVIIALLTDQLLDEIFSPTVLPALGSHYSSFEP